MRLDPQRMPASFEMPFDYSPPPAESWELSSARLFREWTEIFLAQSRSPTLLAGRSASVEPERLWPPCDL